MFVLVYGKDAKKFLTDACVASNKLDGLSAITEEECDEMLAGYCDDIQAVVWLEDGNGSFSPNVLQIVATKKMQDYFLSCEVPVTQPLGKEGILNLLCTLS